MKGPESGKCINEKAVDARNNQLTVDLTWTAWQIIYLLFLTPASLLNRAEKCGICRFISPSSSSDKSAQRVRRIAVTVSVVSVVYVVLEFCNTLIRTQLAIRVIDGVHPPPEFFASMMACQTNHGINIILYCLSGEALLIGSDKFSYLLPKPFPILSVLFQSSFSLFLRLTDGAGKILFTQGIRLAVRTDQYFL